MSNNDSTTSQGRQSGSPNPSTRRRSSFTTNRLSEMFSSARNPNSGSPPNSPQAKSPPAFNQGPFANNTSAAANNAGRRMSITTLGLAGAGSGAGGGNATSGSPGSMPSSNLWGFRRGSTSTSPPSNASSEESAIDDSADASLNGNAVSAGGPAGRRGSGSGNVPPNSPLARRMSFGARAMGQMRNNEPGFNWADNLRNRQSRSSSMGGAAGLMSPTNKSASNEMQAPPSAPPPPKEPAPLPKREGPVKRPDHFQERILKGDFYMD